MYEKKLHTNTSVEPARLVQHSKTVNVIHHVNKLKKGSHMLVPVGAETAFDKTQYPFLILKKYTLCAHFSSTYIDYIYKRYRGETSTRQIIFKRSYRHCHT